MTDSKHVIVTTDHNNRGVFQGELVERSGRSVTLKNARMVVYWSEATRGVLGLAANGPAKGSRVSPAVPRIDLSCVTAVIDMTPTAVEAFEAEPWD